MMKTHLIGFAAVSVLVLAGLGLAQAYNILRYGIESVALVMNDAQAATMREQRSFMTAYNASLEPVREERPKKGK